MHVPLIDLVPVCHMSTSWKGAVFSSLRHLNSVKPWLIVHAQSTRYPYTTTSHAYDPRMHVWVDIEQPSINYVLTLRSRGVARNEHLRGPGCNRNILNIILKSIGYKIINFHISSYT